jgi:hypothetical protein
MSKRDEQEVRRLLNGIEVYVPEEKQRIRRTPPSLQRALFALFDRFGPSGTLLLLGLGALVLGNITRLTFPLAAPLLGVAAACCFGAALFLAFRGNRKRSAPMWRGREMTENSPSLFERIQRNLQSRRRF